MAEEEEKKPVVEVPQKSSMEILSELFNSFDAEPPVIVKKEKSDSPAKKTKKAKKKHKHKDKKHKKKDKKRKRESSPSEQKSEIDLAEILIKQEKGANEQKITIEGTDLSFNIDKVKKEKKEKRRESDRKAKKREEGEVQTDSGDDRKGKKRKHKGDHHDKAKKKKKEEEPKHDEKELQRRIDDLRNKINARKRSRSRSKSRSRDNGYRHRSRDRRRENPFYREDSRQRARRSPTPRSPSRGGIDKKKLLEIARRNAIQMMKSGSLPGALTLGPQAQEKVIAAIRAGGKTVEELTDFCKTLSKQEELGELSTDTDGGSDGDAFHHPFQIKDRPTSITVNIKNSVQLPLKSTQERTSELRLQFPVSSGQQHRKTESDWVPVPPKKVEEQTQTPPMEVTSMVEPTPVEEQVTPSDKPFVDIGSIVSQRLTALRKLQENPNDVQALTEMYKSNKEMQTWAESKQQPGQFTGTTGAQVLSQAELSSGFQAWAKKALVRLEYQGLRLGNRSTSVPEFGPAPVSHARFRRNGHASSAENGLEARRGARQGEDRDAGASPAGG